MFNSHVAFGKQLQVHLPSDIQQLDRALLANKTYINCAQTHNTLYAPKFSKIGEPERIYIQALQMCGEFSLEFSGKKQIVPFAGDFLTGARHEVLVPMIAPDFSAIAGTSSWASVFIENNNREFPARYLSQIYVVPKWVQHNLRGNKLGSMLIRNVEAYAKEVGEKGVFLAASEKSRGFFEKMGYEVHRTFNLFGELSHTMVKRFVAIAIVALSINSLWQNQKPSQPHISA